jgi:hypothetical protein
MDFSQGDFREEQTDPFFRQKKNGPESGQIFRGSLSFAWIKVPCISEPYPGVLPHFKPTQMLRKSIKILD